MQNCSNCDYEVTEENIHWSIKYSSLGRLEEVSACPNCFTTIVLNFPEIEDQTAK